MSEINSCPFCSLDFTVPESIIGVHNGCTLHSYHYGARFFVYDGIRHAPFPSSFSSELSSGLFSKKHEDKDIDIQYRCSRCCLPIVNIVLKDALKCSRDKLLLQLHSGSGAFEKSIVLGRIEHHPDPIEGYFDLIRFLKKVFPDKYKGEISTLTSSYMLESTP